MKALELFQAGKLKEEQKRLQEPAQPLFQPALVPASEARLPHLRNVGEPITSVTENTTRTLEHSFRQT